MKNSSPRHSILKTLLSIVIVYGVVLSPCHAAGGTGMHGGSLKVCYDARGNAISAELLDYHQARARNHQPELGAPGSTVAQMIDHVLGRLSKIDRTRAERFRRSAAEILAPENFQDVEISPPSDIGGIALPVGCKPVPIAVQKSKPLPGELRYTISNLWWKSSLISDQDRAGLVLHEAIYREWLDTAASLRYVGDANLVRYFNGIISSVAIEAYTLRTYRELLIQLPLATMDAQGGIPILILELRDITGPVRGWNGPTQIQPARVDFHSDHLVAYASPAPGAELFLKSVLNLKFNSDWPNSISFDPSGSVSHLHGQSEPDSSFSLVFPASRVHVFRSEHLNNTNVQIALDKAGNIAAEIYCTYYELIHFEWDGRDMVAPRGGCFTRSGYPFSLDINPVQYPFQGTERFIRGIGLYETQVLQYLRFSSPEPILAGLQTLEVTAVHFNSDGGFAAVTPAKDDCSFSATVGQTSLRLKTAYDPDADLGKTILLHATGAIKRATLCNDVKLMRTDGKVKKFGANSELNFDEQGRVN